MKNTDGNACLPEEARHTEKMRAARSSLFWALFLVLIKLVAGLATNSLGVLSETLHSGLDMVAAAVTLYAVHLASRPADSRHPYGYGKVESIAALIETGLLLITCFWIVAEAVGRLFFRASSVEPSWWAAGVVVVALAVDVSRSRMLAAVARKHRSRALEADALHFATDVWSSAVVLLGLGGAAWARCLPPESAAARILTMADAVAALVVAGFVLRVGLRLAVKSFASLMDADRGECVARVARDLAVHDMTITVKGDRTMIFLHAEADPNASLKEAHEEIARFERELGERMGAVVVSHIEPMSDASYGAVPHTEEDERRIRETMDEVLDTFPEIRSVHDDEVQRLGGESLLSVHVEVDGDMPVIRAHDLAERVERALRARCPGLGRVIVHTDPAGVEE